MRNHPRNSPVPNCCFRPTQNVMTPTPEGIRVMPSGKKTILVVDHSSPSLIALAEHLGAVPDGQVLMAHSSSGAIDMARQYQPEVAIVVRSLVATGGQQLLSDLIKEVSPGTHIIIANDLASGNGRGRAEVAHPAPKAKPRSFSRVSRTGGNVREPSLAQDDNSGRETIRPA
jgi:hypothetical protein